MEQFLPLSRPIIINSTYRRSNRVGFSYNEARKACSVKGKFTFHSFCILKYKPDPDGCEAYRAQTYFKDKKSNQLFYVYLSLERNALLDDPKAILHSSKKGAIEFLKVNGEPQ